MLERCSGIINSQELPEQRSGVQKMSSSVVKTNPNRQELLEFLPNLGVILSAAKDLPKKKCKYCF